MELIINDMHCGHCVQSITKAVQALDANATVEANLDARKVKVETSASESDVRKAISAIGFDAQ